ncbi:MAG: GIY-YIG nuclease family protein [Proteobacteria bacterium]|nr:GIY-YIG nuclease family protein [Pseudomonadota bacterium]MDE3208700.1 GIY-YIG nuclease family protein [Pseudomonadota bacterium]
MTWFVYILECRGGSLYTGITTDIEARLLKHNLGRASKYTRSHLPVQLIWKEVVSSRVEAQSREAAIKRLSRMDKLALIHLEGKTGTI